MNNSSVKHSIKYNFCMNFLLKFASLIFPLITYPYASRVLNPSGIGKVSFAISVIAYFAIFATMGISTYGVKACAKVRDDKEALSKLVQELFSFTLICSFFVYAALGLSLRFVDRFSSDSILFAISSLQIILTVVGCDWLFSAIEDYTYITIRSLVFKLIGLVLLFLFVKDSDDYIIYAAISVFSSYGSYLMNSFRIRKIIHLKKYKLNLLQHIKPMLTFFAVSVAVSIYTNLDTAMLGFMQDDYTVGLYNTATKVKTILSMVISSLGTVMLPRLSYYIERGNFSEFNLSVKKSFNFILLFSIPVIALFEIFAYETIMILSGSEYILAIVPMRILLLTIFFSSIANLTGMQILIPTNREKIYLYSVILGSVVDLILNLILIPKIGATGAAMGTLAAEMAGCILQCIYLRKFIYNSLDGRHIIDIVIATCFASICVIFVKQLFVNVVFRLMVGAVVFAAVFSIYMILRKNNMFLYFMDQVKSVIKNKKFE